MRDAASRRRRLLISYVEERDAGWHAHYSPMLQRQRRGALVARLAYVVNIAVARLDCSAVIRQGRADELRPGEILRLVLLYPTSTNCIIHAKELGGRSVNVSIVSAMNQRRPSVSILCFEF